MHEQCKLCGRTIYPNNYVGDIIGSFCTGHDFGIAPIISRPIVISTDSTTPLCPLTNSSHEKALVRVVEKHERIYEKGEFVKLLEGDFIQVLCGCGHIISEAEIKSK